MSPVPAEQRTRLAPAMIAAVLLHAAVIVGGLIVWPSNRPLAIGGATTVTLVDAPPAELRTAVQAEEVAPAASEEPSPEVPLEPPAPTPEPLPPAPAPKAAPAPTPKPAPAKPAAAPKASAPAKPKPKAADSDSWLASLANAGGAPKSGAAKGGERGKPKAAASAVATTGSGSANAALGDASAAVGQRLKKAWTIDCSLEGMSGVTVKVRFQLGRNGELIGQPRVLNPGSGPAAVAAADRALIAVSRAAPFPELPKESYNVWKDFTANFLGSEACR